MCDLHIILSRKCQEYTPANSSKMWEKAVSRRHGNMYSPREVIEEVEREAIGKRKNNSKEDCIKLYMHVSRCMYVCMYMYSMYVCMYCMYMFVCTVVHVQYVCVYVLYVLYVL